MRVKTRNAGKVWIIQVSGEMKNGQETKVTEACRQIVATGGRLIVIDLLRVPWIGSEGLGEIMMCRQDIAKIGGQLKIVLSGKTHGLFIVCSLQKVLDLHENLEETLASFAPEVLPLGESTLNAC